MVRGLPRGVYPPVLLPRAGGGLLVQPRVLAQEDELKFEPFAIVSGQYPRAEGTGGSWPRQHQSQPLTRLPAAGDHERRALRAGLQPRRRAALHAPWLDAQTQLGQRCATGPRQEHQGQTQSLQSSLPHLVTPLPGSSACRPSSHTERWPDLGSRVYAWSLLVKKVTGCKDYTRAKGGGQACGDGQMHQ